MASAAARFGGLLSLPSRPSTTEFLYPDRLQLDEVGFVLEAGIRDHELADHAGVSKDACAPKELAVQGGAATFLCGLGDDVESGHAIMKQPPFWAAFEEVQSAEPPTPDSLASTKTITATREEDDQDNPNLNPSDLRPRVLHALTQTLTKMREEQDQDAPLAPPGVVPRAAHVATKTVTEMREETDQDQPLRGLFTLPRTSAQ